MQRLFAFASPCLLLVIAGCDPATPTDAGTDVPLGADVPETLDVPALDAPEGTDAGGGVDGGGVDAPASGARGGVIQVAQNVTPSATSGSLSGFFGAFTADQALMLDLDPCIRTRVGACVAARCGATPPAVDGAGTITVSRAGTTLASVMALPSGVYGSAITTALAAGDVISLSTTGDVVPALSGDVTMPALPDFALPTTVSRAAGFTVTWDPTFDADYIGVTVITASGGLLVTCGVPASDGTVTVVPEVLADVADGSVLVGVASANRTSVTAGDYAVALQVAQGRSSTATMAP